MAGEEQRRQVQITTTMCGIAGQAVYLGVADSAALHRALDAMVHRGPDDDGLQIVGTASGDVQVILGSRRLAILDLSPAGHQPMHDPATGNWIVYNGEVFNFAEVRRELETLDVHFVSHTDTEVILKGYAVWGESCIERFRGMFAFALWDAARQRLFLCRDRLGIKPLYYYNTERQFLFSSEVRSLLATGLVPKRLHVVSLADYLTFGSACDPDTLIEDVHSLPSGSYLMWERGRVRQVQYWEPTSAGNELPPCATARDIQPHLHDLLREAVALRLVSDVPLGVFLSGGIDSSAMVSLIAETGQQVSTFSIVFREQSWSEAQYSSAVARHFRTDHHEVTLSSEDFRQALPDALRALDQPSIDGVNTYVVSREVRRKGLKVALSGLGSDEIFAGYNGFRRIPYLQRILRRIQFAPAPLRHFAAQVLGGLTPRSDANAKLVALIQSNGGGDLAYFVSRMLFLPTQREQLLYPRKVVDYTARLGSFSPTSDNFDPVNRISCLELCNYMRNTLLRDADCMSMAHGLEVRVPFLDHKLVDFVTAIPGHLKLDRSTPKPLLVHSLHAPLPHDVVYRPKRGFNLPFAIWMRGPMHAEIGSEFARWPSGPLVDYLNTSAVQQVWANFLEGKTSWSRPWALFVLSRWVKQNLVS